MLFEEVEKEGDAIEFVSLWFVLCWLLFHVCIVASLFLYASAVCLCIVLEKYIPYYDFD